uniref:Uncharacterized protein n=1 Tax=Timema cristinae TaxID=61476 RepID=A0A7R9D277_TIMCR|nr:unnamed protein product [Timema cristinae]
MCYKHPLTALSKTLSKLRCHSVFNPVSLSKLRCHSVFNPVSLSKLRCHSVFNPVSLSKLRCHSVFNPMSLSKLRCHSVFNPVSLSKLRCHSVFNPMSLSKLRKCSNSESLKLETCEERSERWLSIYIIYFTMFLMSLGFSIILTGVWPYLDKVWKESEQDIRVTSTDRKSCVRRGQSETRKQDKQGPMA